MKIKLSTYAKQNDISYMTAYRMVKDGKLPFTTLPTGTILVDIESKDNIDKNKAVLYARVSSSENKQNLETQMERLRSYATAKGYFIVKEVKEVGSGLNDKRIQLERILTDDYYDIIVVEHKDRFSRFGVNYIDKLLFKLDKSLEIINQADNNKDDLMQDFVSIITSFTARLYGQRRSKRKTEKIIEDLNNND